MYRHTPVNLRGPFTRSRAWWKFPPPKPRAAVQEVRADLVARVRREIADGTYDTPDKWEAALERLLARLDWS